MQKLTREDLDTLLSQTTTALKSVSRKKYQGDKFGDDELSIGDVIEVIRDLITSLKSLTKSKHTFSMLVDAEERQLIFRKLKLIRDHLKDDRLDLVFNHLSELVRNLRGMNLRSGWSLVAGAKESVRELDERANVLLNRERQLQNAVNKLEARTEEVEALRQKVMDDAKAIGGFLSKIDERSVELEKQSSQTASYEKKVQEFEDQHTELLDKAKSLISEAESALEVKSAEGLSKAFKSKATKANSKLALLWVGLASFFIFSTMVIGWKLFDAGELGTAHVVARLSLIPVLLTGAWFAASRYVYQKNLAEDYDYKQVLMSSHVAFSNHLKSESNGDTEYQEYIKGFLREIYQHPTKKGYKTSPEAGVSNQDNKLLGARSELDGVGEYRQETRLLKAKIEEQSINIAELSNKIRELSSKLYESP